MTRKNQFWKGMLLGALAGGAISLFDKPTREAMKENLSKTSNKVAYIVRNPGEIADKVKGTANKIKTTFEQVSEDISYITDKVEEIKELTPQVTEMMKETKDTFTGSEEADLLEEVRGEGVKIK
ncbi:YtxH domain-containing protein [Neobacillus sp. MM2021_6]|uniref:YtxH domain-containing protein n=1 Tax=Bacillaceae TaxID=186817 RepID=UPI001409FA0C|nr:MULTISPECIES: YtxH domain-containing protein [Bacillaceae]MBO0960677.1 YtxH domain-containing protein [Neobacillus sp. MM2021_6]NHC18399.1 YtxH domain-containing protein [Bacillus sp. MM2020_4]WML38454.1 YtxH domain-containing protein [Neobacillus sp. OS1-2]